MVGSLNDTTKISDKSEWDRPWRLHWP